MATLIAPSLPSAPVLRLHKSRQYYVRIPASLGGGSRWFGRDPVEAEQRYLGFVRDLKQIPSLTRDAAKTPAYGYEGEQRTVARVGNLISDLVSEFVQSRISDIENISKKNWDYRLKKFKKDFGNREIHSLTPKDLERFRISLKDFSPYTSNPILNHVAAFLKWTYESGTVEVPFRLGSLKAYKNKPTKSKALSPEQVGKIIRETAKNNIQTARAMLLQFYCTLRPSEVPRVIWNDEQVTNGVSLIYSKTTNKTGSMRPVLLTPEALSLIADIKAGANANGNDMACRSMTSYQLGCRRHGNVGPHFLRHSSAQCLSDSGVREEHIRVAMGRVKARVDRVYVARENFAEALEAVKVLSRKVPLSILDVAKMKKSA